MRMRVCIHTPVPPTPPKIQVPPRAHAPTHPILLPSALLAESAAKVELERRDGAAVGEARVRVDALRVPLPQPQVVALVETLGDEGLAVEDELVGGRAARRVDEAEERPRRRRRVQAAPAGEREGDAPQVVASDGQPQAWRPRVPRLSLALRRDPLLDLKPAPPPVWGLGFGG